MNDAIIATSPEHEIVNSRTINVNINKVFKAWTEPEYLKKWWGPKGFSNTFEEFDLRPGGRWKFVMHGPDKGHYRNECEFLVIDSPNLIAWKRHSKPHFNVVATFFAQSPESTLVVFRQIFETIEECNKLKPYVVDKNEENFDRLEAELLLMN